MVMLPFWRANAHIDSSKRREVRQILPALAPPPYWAEFALAPRPGVND